MHENGLRAQDVGEAQGAGRSELERLEIGARATDAIVELRRDKDGTSGVPDACEPARDVARAQPIAIDAVEAERLDDEDAAIRRVRAERLGERRATHLRGQTLRVSAAIWSKDHTAVPPVWRTGRALTGTSGALLSPGLRPTARHARAVLRRRRRLPRIRERGDQRLEEDARSFRRSRESGGQLDRSLGSAVGLDQRRVASGCGRKRPGFGLRPRLGPHLRGAALLARGLRPDDARDRARDGAARWWLGFCG